MFKIILEEHRPVDSLEHLIPGIGRQTCIVSFRAQDNALLKTIGGAHDFNGITQTHIPITNAK